MAMTPYYQDGSVTIYHGDCREIVPMLGTFPLLLTDPPYGVNKDTWDDVSCEWVVDLCRDLCDTLLITPGIKMAWRFPPPVWVASYCFPRGDKRAVGGGLNCWEPVLIYGKNPFSLDCRVFKPTASLRVDGHSTPKPLQPWQWLIAEGSGPGDTILDPFAGTGTTGTAAKNLGRSAVLVEIEEKYCEIAARRCSQEVLAL